MGVGEANDLRRMRYLMNRLPAAIYRVERAQSMATRCTAELTGMPRSNAVGSPVESGVERLMLAKERLLEIQSELGRLREKLLPMLDTLCDPLEKAAMHLRYISGMSAREIAYRLAYSEQHVFRVLRAAEGKITGEEKEPR